jgi:hypothetical protein
MVELILFIHFIIVLYLVVGFPIGLYFNHRLFRIVHASALAGVSLLMVLGVPCPLTIWEEMLRQGPVYEGSFIASWLNRIIYLEGVNPAHVVWLDIAFAVLVISSFFWRPLTYLRGGKTQHDNPATSR